jgi:hypothetical protein
MIRAIVVAYASNAMLRGQVDTQLHLGVITIQ